MNMIFCSEPMNPKAFDSFYLNEVECAREKGIQCYKIDFELLSNDNNVEKSLKSIPYQEKNELAIYRGWMLSVEHYNNLYHALLEKGYQLVNNIEQYRHCHYLPESYSIIQNKTANTIWISNDQDQSIDKIMDRLQVFENKPVVLKDYVKSQKHYWKEACFIPDASDQSSVKKVLSRFLELQGNNLQGGLVFREYLDLKPIGRHSKSAMPLTKEYRIFYYYKKPIILLPYWDEGNYDITPDINEFNDIGKKVDSNFFTMDIAQKNDNSWAIVELGDGQVAGLPDNANLQDFYKS